MDLQLELISMTCMMWRHVALSLSFLISEMAL